MYPTPCSALWVWLPPAGSSQSKEGPVTVVITAVTEISTQAKSPYLSHVSKIRGKWRTQDSGSFLE